MEGHISEGQFARFIRTDRTTARRFAHQLSHRIRMDASGQSSDLEIAAFDAADVVTG